MKAIGIAVLAAALAFGGWTAGKSACASVKASVTIHRAASDA